MILVQPSGNQPSWGSLASWKQNHYCQKFANYLDDENENDNCDSMIMIIKLKVIQNTDMNHMIYVP